MLARIIANRYPFVILDEPTSALDPLTERKINRYVMQTLASPERTILFISHRLFTTQLADRILVFDKGTIVEEGNHCELMKKKGHYYEMYQLQQKLYGQEEIESAKRKTIVRNNFYLFGRSHVSRAGICRAVGAAESCRQCADFLFTGYFSGIYHFLYGTEKNAGIYSDVYRNLVFDRRSHLCGSELFLKIAISRCVRKSWYSLCSGNYSKNADG